MFIKIKVQTNCKKEGIIKKGEDSFLIKVKEKPIQGKANARILEMISGYLGIEAEKIRIIKGSKTPNKLLEI